jgi:acetyltransferase
METLLADRDNDAILVMNVPTALASASDAAKRLQRRRTRTAIGFFHRSRCLRCGWGDTGDAAVELEAAGIPHYPSESTPCAASCISYAIEKPSIT